MTEPDRRPSALKRPFARLRRWPLRRRLMVSMATLIVAAVVIIGSVSVSMQRQSLITRLDDQVGVALDVTSRSVAEAQSADGQEATEGTPDGDLRQGREGGQEGQEAEGGEGGEGGQGGGSPGDGDLGPGPQLGSLTLAIVDGTTLIAQLVDQESGTVHPLDDDEIDLLREAVADTADPVEVDLGERGSYRVAAEPLAPPGPGENAEADEAGIVVAGQSMSEVDRTARDQIVTFSLVALGAVAGTLLAALVLIRLGMRPLQRLVHVARGVSDTPLTGDSVDLPQRVQQDDADPHTEVGEVGSALNTMLDHVEGSLRRRQQSEERLRQFVADASHELRTPLAAIRGYAELAGGADGAVPPHVSRSLDRIHSESTRMSTLVEDLLLLARLDAGAPLRRHRVEVARVVVDACADAQVIGPGHQWVLDLGEAAAEIVVDGDEDSLRQVMTNLLANARTHTPPGTTVTVGLTAAAGSRALITVQDDGPGIPEDLQARVFDRFVRGDESRSRSAGSTGLGTAIVEAIVRAHGGEVTLTSAPGNTRFTVSLPLSR